MTSEREQNGAFTERETGKYLGISAATLRLWRSKGTGPRYFVAGEKLIRYRCADLDSWIEARLSTPEPDAPKAAGNGSDASLPEAQR